MKASTQRRPAAATPRNALWKGGLLILLVLSAFAGRAQERVIWRETFEGNADLWDADRGVWDFGEPSNPRAPKAIQGTRCAGVGMRANYPANASSAFARHRTFVVPPADQNPRIRFDHWFSIYLADYGVVRIREAGGEPKEVSARFFGNSGWSRASIPLREFAGKSVQIEFYFFSDGNNPGGGTAPGWFIDDVAFTVGDWSFNGFEGFEGQQLWSFDPWTSTRGSWQIGRPENGPLAAHTGLGCAGVVLKDGYFDFVDSALVSPPFVVPSLDQNPSLGFFHWFSVYSGDFGEVRIREEGGNSVAVSERFSGNSHWGRTAVSLKEFAGKRVQVEFLFNSNGDGRSSLAAGWFVDDVELRTGEYEFRGKEGFEQGWSDWYSTRGNWQIGTPTGGPKLAHEGTHCAALSLPGGYFDLVDSALVSPPFVVPPLDQGPRLRFYHWFSIYGGDYGQIRVRAVGGSPEVVSPQYSGNSDWSRATVPLDKFAGQTVQVEFHFSSNSDGLSRLAAGWFVDEVEILPALPNRWPVLAAVETQIAREGSPVTFTATATDSDAGQSLRFSIDESTRPAKAAIDPNTGVFSWQPTREDLAEEARYLRVRVTDNGTPPRSDSRLVAIATPGSLRLHKSHSWEPLQLTGVGGVPGLSYTNYSVSKLKGDSIWPGSLPASPETNLVLRFRGEAFRLENLTNSAADQGFFFMRGDTLPVD